MGQVRIFLENEGFVRISKVRSQHQMIDYSIEQSIIGHKVYFVQIFCLGTKIEYLDGAFLIKEIMWNDCSVFSKDFKRNFNGLNSIIGRYAMV